MGFKKLGIAVSDEMMARMAKESIYSPQLMQSICLNIGLLPDSDLTITDHMVEESCRFTFTCMNLPYGDIVLLLRARPPKRGQQRLKYHLVDGSSRDIYSLILKVLADNPPLIELGIGELMERVRGNLSE